MKETKCILQEAKAAVSSLAVLKSEEKNKALLAMADALIADTSSILCENKKIWTQQRTLYLLSCLTD